MAYVKPGVQVTQDFVNTQAELATFQLPSVVVGPVFQIVPSTSAGSYTGGSYTYAWPGQTAGTYVDTRVPSAGDLVSYPPTVNLQNTTVTVLSGTAGAATSGSTTFTDATSSQFATILAGDVIVIASGSNAGSYTVRSITDSNDLVSNTIFPATGSSIAYTIIRNLGASGSVVNIPLTTAGVVVSQANGITLPASLTASSFPIVSATVLLQYRALMVNQSTSLKSYANTTALQVDYPSAQIIPQNHAVFGVYLALLNSVSPTNLLGLDSTYLTNELQSYEDALVVLTQNDVYAISVMTQNTSVHSVLQTHVDGLSVPAEKLERVGIVNRKLVTTQVVTSTVNDATTDSGGTHVTSASSHFITAGVVPGDFVNIASQRIAITAVVSQTQLTIATTAGSSLSSQALFVDENLDADEQAATLAAYAQSLGDRRMVMTWPDTCTVPVGSALVSVPGYFLNAAVGALTTGLPTQQGLTNLALSVFTGLTNSNDVFSGDQLNVIAGGGVMVFVQDVLNVTAIYCRHQLTTDRASIVFQEYSITKNVDFIAKFIRTNNAPYIGQYNIVQGTFDDIKTNSAGLIKFLTESTVLPKIGGVISGGTLTSIIQDPVNIDTIDAVFSLNIPIPLNYLNITLMV
jgi:hypothetical protein